MEKSLPRNPLKPLGLNPDGSEIVDDTPMQIGLRGPVKSAEMKLKEMLARELEKQKRPNESELDGFDFELEDETPQLHHSVDINPMSANEIRREYREQQIRKKQKAAKHAAAEGAEGSSNSPKQPAKTKPKQSASENSTEGADDQEKG